MPNSVSGANPAVWSKYIAKTYDASSLFVPLVNRSVEADLSSEGDVVHVQKPGNITVSNYTVGTDFAGQTVSLTDDTLTLDQKKAFMFTIDDIEKALSQHDLIKMFIGRGAVAMAQTMDDRIITHTADALAANKIGTTAAPVTLTQDNIYSYFVKAAQNLDEANIPADDRVFVIDPATKALLLKSPDLIKATAKGDSIIEKATVGELAGFRVVVSNRYTTASNTRTLMYFHRDFISLAVRLNPGKIEMFRDPNQFGTRVRSLAFYGSKVFNSAAGGHLVKSA